MDKTTEYFRSFLESLSQSDIFVRSYSLLTHWMMPLLAVIIFLRCVYPLFQRISQNNIWGYLGMPDGELIPINHWENSIGRSRLSDIVLPISFISRNHAVLSYNGRDWSIADIGSKGGIEVNGEKINQKTAVNEGDIISLAGFKFTLLPAGAAEAGIPGLVFDEKPSPPPSRTFKPVITLLLILLFQFMGSFQIILNKAEEVNIAVALTFLLFIAMEFIYFYATKAFSNKYFELELLVFFLCGINLLVVSSSAPGSLYKQLIAIAGGIIAFTIMKVLLRDLTVARALKYLLSAAGIILLVLNLTIGETRFGAKNWINLGFITFQPLELVKVSFVIAGAATLDKLLTTRNLTAFIAYSGACIGVLVLIRDLGTAVIFFAAFIVIAFMRSGDVRTIALICSGAALGAVAVVSLFPYIAARFAVWGKVWENANASGYQQTRTMIYAASGGLLGVGGGNGHLIGIPAADTDLVFGIICEEWGLIIGIIAVMTIVFFAVFASWLTRSCRSSFYALSACGAASIFLVQIALNVFGSLDLLPLTGVTFPFISNGGTSMIASWALLAFIKAADERKTQDKNIKETSLEGAEIT
jgi:cell division protein FtsW